MGTVTAAFSEGTTQALETKNKSQAPESIATSDLQGFDAYPDKVKRVIELALALTTKNLGYQYGSADPQNGAMDCSGTMYYLLTQLKIAPVPRSSEALYQWAKKTGHFYPLEAGPLQMLKPGDLIFWKGTYPTASPNIASHVMVYLGKNKQGDLLMAGASNGRTYKGRKIYGVSVFDFILPAANSKSIFLGHSCIPNYTCRTGHVTEPTGHLQQQP